MKTTKHLWSIVTCALLSLCICCTEDILPIAVEGLELNLTTISMKVGESKTLTVTITPADAENQTVKWSSTNKSVASVEDGEITAHKAGETTISVTSEDGGFRASCTVTVTEEQNPDDGNNNDSGNNDSGDDNGDDTGNEDEGAPIAVESVELDVSELSMTVGECATLTATVNPDVAANKNVVWSSSDNNTASVDNGKVTANIEGTATITVTTEDGNFKAYCAVTVKENEPLTVPNNEIWYTTNDGRIAAISESAFNTSVISNTYENEKGRLKFNEEITSIGDEAFYDCSNLASIEIPESVVSIGVSAFSGCSNLAGIEIPSSVTAIGIAAFIDCYDLVTVKLPDGITTINRSTFEGCMSLTTVEIPSSVKSIGDKAFLKCYKLASIKLPPNLISIGHEVFCHCNITDIEIPPSVTSIGVEAFAYSGLKNVKICDGATVVDGFDECSTLESVEIPSSVKSIGKEAFFNCKNLTNIVLPSGLTSIGESAFSGCSNLAGIEIPSSVTSIGEVAFYACSSLKNMVIPSGVTSIKVGTFASCTSLTSVEIPSSVTTIEGSAFEHCSKLISIEIPSGVISIGESVFERSGLRSVKIPSSVKSIGKKAFNNKDAFGYCPLYEIYLNRTTPPKVASDTFPDNNKMITIYIPMGCVGNYLKSPWTNYKIKEYDFGN